MLLISDSGGNPVRWIEGPSSKGLHRVNWDLRYAAPDPINLTKPKFVPPWAGSSQGPLASPGTYSAELFLMHQGNFESLGSPQSFEVKPVPSLPDDTDYVAAARFQQETGELSRQVSSANRAMGEVRNKIRHMKPALSKTPKSTPQLFSQLEDLETRLSQLQMQLSGDWIRQGLSESTTPSIRSRVGYVMGNHWGTRQEPTETQKRNIEMARKDFDQFKVEMTSYLNDLKDFEAALERVGAPWTPGRKME
jgi:hypothetical protein